MNIFHILITPKEADVENKITKSDWASAYNYNL